MRATLCLCLAAAYVISLVEESLGGCVSETWGAHGGNAFRPGNITVDLNGQSNVTVHLPIVTGCRTVGIDADFCEAESLSVFSNFTVIVHVSKDNTAPTGVLNAVIYCKPFY